MKKRNEIEESMKWDLTTIFKTKQDFENSFNEAQKLIKDFPKYKDTMLNSKKDLYQTLENYFNLDEKLNKLYEYASLMNASDLGNSENQVLKGRVDNLITDFSKASIFINNKILSIPEVMFKHYLSDTSEEYNLNDFKTFLHEVYRYKKYTLSDSEEKLLATLSAACNPAEGIFSVLSDVDLKFGTIKDENGKDVELTEENFTVFLKSKDRNVRKSAFTTLYSKIKEFKNTFTSIFAANVETGVSISKARGYKSSLERSLYSDHVTPEIYNNIINNVSNHLDVLFKYYNLKKEVLGLDDMHIYDIYLPMISNYKQKEYTFEEAKNEVLNAVSIFGDEYVNILKNGYDNRWVDVYPNENKRGGAFSAGCASTNPFILLNFLGTEYDVSVLAHESGHSMHSYYSRHNNPSYDSYYKIFVAEVPSTVNELILAYYRLEHSNDDLEKLNILNSLLELYKSTIYRQIMFAEFEKITTELVEQNQVLTADLLTEKYYELNKKYFGDTIILDKEIAYEWMRIPHFYYDFYVYKYAIGLAAASHIVKEIRNGNKEALDKYFDFLKLGGSKNPIDSLKVAGVDLTNTKVFDDAAYMFDDLINQFSTLYKKIYKK